jgi:hypothetical protein
MSSIEHIDVLVETIRARIDTLKSDPDPDPDPDDATRADLERCMYILAALEEGRGRLMSLKMNPLTALA